MREYRQLTEDDRIEIYAMKQAEKNQKNIAGKLGVSQSGELSQIVGQHAQAHVNFTMLKSLLPHRICGEAVQYRNASLRLGTVFLVAAEFGFIQSLDKRRHTPAWIVTNTSTKKS